MSLSRSLRVLIVDDDSELRMLAAVSLGRFGGMSPLEACTGAEGVWLARQERPDAILLDAWMPEMDGPSTLEALRRDPATADIPVIFLTAATTAEERSRLTGLGAIGLLAKPFNPRNLAQAVSALLESRRTRAA